MVVKTKVCTHCGQMKDASLFYKKSKSKDGLQDWCKECKRQARIEHHIKAEERRLHSLYERLRYYKNNHGLSYKLLKTVKSSGRKVKIVKFNCWNCGKEVVLPLGLAASKKFVCDSCSLVISKYNKCNCQKPTVKHSTRAYSIKKSNVGLISEKQTDLLQELRKQYPNANIVITFESCETKYPDNTIPNSVIEHTSCQCSKKKGVFSWVKSLFK